MIVNPSRVGASSMKVKEVTVSDLGYGHFYYTDAEGHAAIHNGSGKVEMMAGSSLVAISDETYRSPEATGATLVTKDTYGSSRGRVYVYAYQVDA